MAVVTGVDHFGATVSDIERSLAFWRDLLGLEEVGRGVIEWEHIDRLVALPDTKIEWVELRVPGGGTGRADAVPPPRRRAARPHRPGERAGPLPSLAAGGRPRPR